MTFSINTHSHNHNQPPQPKNKKWKMKKNLQHWASTPQKNASYGGKTDVKINYIMKTTKEETKTKFESAEKMRTCSAQLQSSFKMELYSSSKFLIILPYMVHSKTWYGEMMLKTSFLLYLTQLTSHPTWTL